MNRRRRGGDTTHGDNNDEDKELFHRSNLMGYSDAVAVQSPSPTQQRDMDEYSVEVEIQHTTQHTQHTTQHSSRPKKKKIIESFYTANSTSPREQNQSFQTHSFS